MKIKLSKFVCLIFTFVLSLIFSTIALADSFFEVGKTYLFIGRFDVAMKGRVVQVTDQEIVFTDRYILKHSKAVTQAGNDAKAVAIKANAIAEYLKSKNKASLLEASPLNDVPTSYSRSEMTAVKVEG